VVATMALTTLLASPLYHLLNSAAELVRGFGL
jgi:hypothetical protein